MIDIKFSKDFDQELEKVFENLEKNKSNENAPKSFVSPYCYDVKSAASFSESFAVGPLNNINMNNTDQHESSPSKSKQRNYISSFLLFNF